MKRILRRDRPTILRVTPPAIPPHTSARQLQEAVGMVRFALELCEIQEKGGRAYVLELPVKDRAWNLPTLATFVLKEEVMIKDVTPRYRAVTNSVTISDTMQRMRSRGGVASADETRLSSVNDCPDWLCDAMLKAVGIWSSPVSKLCVGWIL